MLGPGCADARVRRRWKTGARPGSRAREGATRTRTFCVDLLPALFFMFEFLRLSFQDIRPVCDLMKKLTLSSPRLVFLVKSGTFSQDKSKRSLEYTRSLEPEENRTIGQTILTSTILELKKGRKLCILMAMAEILL